MTQKATIRKRLSTAIGADIPKSTFTWFFGRFCEVAKRPDLKTRKMLDLNEVEAFSEYAGYDLKFPIPLPLRTQI